MAAPNVFVSSTFYDLRYIRERISFFLRSLGYNAILSEEGAVFYDPRSEVADACVAEVPNCQLFVLIIGGRYGSVFGEKSYSVTNAEYKEAHKLRIPIFALVEEGVYNDFKVYRANRSNPGFDPTTFTFPNADDPRIFDFIEEVQTAAVNNALVPSVDYGDMEDYLRQQWAGMMYSYLTGASEERRATDMLEVIADTNRRIEVLSTQILASVGSDREKALANIYDRMLTSVAVKDLQYIGLSPRPTDVLAAETLDAFAGDHEKRFVEADEKIVISGTGAISPSRYAQSSADYLALRIDLAKYMAAGGITADELEALDRGRR